MNRYFMAIEAVSDRLPIQSISEGFDHAVKEVLAENADPHQDPAVLLLGKVISFYTHADTAIGDMGYRKLAAECHARIEQRALQ